MALPCVKNVSHRPARPSKELVAHVPMAMGSRCSREQRQIDESAKAGDPYLRAHRNEAQQDGSDHRRVADQLMGEGFVEDGENDGPAHFW